MFLALAQIAWNGRLSLPSVHSGTHIALQLGVPGPVRLRAAEPEGVRSGLLARAAWR